MNLVIFCHPSKDSHSGKALEVLEKSFKDEGKEYEVLDLYKMGFDPILRNEEIKALKNKEKMPADVVEIQDKIAKAERLFFIYPVWWYNYPAMLKGFLDRVITSGFAFKFKSINKFMHFGAKILALIPGVRYLAQPYSARGFFRSKSAVIIRTFGGPSYGSKIFGQTEKALDDVILRFCGITKIKKIELFAIDTKFFSEKDEMKFYEKVKKSI